MRHELHHSNPSCFLPYAVFLLFLVFTPLIDATETTSKPDAPLRVAVISDLNGSYGSTHYSKTIDKAIQEIIQLKPDLIINAGDMVAGQRVPHLSEKQVNDMWQGFHRHVTKPLQKAGLLMAVTPGNHDGSAYPGFEHERRIYGEQWIQHRPALTFVDDKHYPYFYAFEKSDVLFVSLDVTTTGDLPELQKSWLYKLLELHGERYKHRIVFSHVPLWPFAQRRESGYSGDRELEKLLKDHHIDLYLSGHHHTFYPGYKDGLYLVGLSCLGSGPRKLVGTRTRSPRSVSYLEIKGDIKLGAKMTPAPGDMIDWHTLPKAINTLTATIQRADLVTAPEHISPLTSMPLEQLDHWQ